MGSRKVVGGVFAILAAGAVLTVVPLANADEAPKAPVVEPTCRPQGAPPPAPSSLSGMFPGRSRLALPEVWYSLPICPA
jgi:hypothetical protein